MNEEKEKLVIKLLKYIDVDVSSLDEILSYELEAHVIRDVEKIKLLTNHREELKNFFKSSKLTSLHANNSEKQRFPVLNTYRQILRYSGYRICSKNVAIGYDPSNGKKITKRVYFFRKKT
jgi:hypothetical protein